MCIIKSMVDEKETISIMNGESTDRRVLREKVPREKGKDEIRKLTGQLVEKNENEISQVLAEMKGELSGAMERINQVLQNKLRIGKSERKEFEDFIDTIGKEVDKIIRGNENEIEKYKKLDKLKRDKLAELREKVEKLRGRKAETVDLKNEAKGSEKILVDRVIKLQERIVGLEARKERIVSLKKKTQARGKITKEVKNWLEERDEIIEEMRLVADEVDKLKLVEQYGGLEVLLQNEIDKAVRKGVDELGEGAVSALEIETNLDLLKGAEDYQLNSLKEEIEWQIQEALKASQIDRKIATELLESLKKIYQERRGRIKDRILEEKEDEVRRGLEEKGLKGDVLEKELKRAKKLEGGDYEALAKAIGKDDLVVAAVNELARRIEANAKLTDEALDRIATARGDGSFIEYQKAYYEWRKDKESPFRSERLLDDAKREIIEIAMIRIGNKGGDKAVTEEDIKTWVKERLARVIGGGEASTGYTARQFLGEIGGILESPNLKFKELIDQDRLKAEQDLTYLENNINISKVASEKQKEEILKRVRRYKETLSAFDSGKGFVHVEQISNRFKELMNAVLGTYEVDHAYGRSGSAEDMIRIYSALETNQMGLALELEDVRKLVSGRVSFYEVEINEATHKRAVLETKMLSGQITEKQIKQLHSAELQKGELYLEITTEDGKKVLLSPENIEDLLYIKDESVGVMVGDIMDIIDQERFANGVLSRRAEVRDHFKAQVVREAIMYRMGLVNLDGEVQIEKVKELAEKKYGKLKSLIFKRDDGSELAQDAKGLRMKLIVGQIGNKKTEWVRDKLSRETIEYVDGTSGREKKIKVEVLFGGLREKSRDNLENQFKMVYKLGEGIWHFNGLSIAHWNKDHEGDSKDWHLKIIHFPRYNGMYGIMPGHIREHVSVDFGDFITRRKTDILPELFKHKWEDIEKKKKAVENRYKGNKERIAKEKEWIDEEYKEVTRERKELMELLMTDRDGFVMSRQRFLDIYGEYRRLGKKEGEKWLRDRLLERAKYYYSSDAKGERMVVKHWKEIIKVDWSKKLEKGLGGLDGVPDGETIGFDGLYWWVKKNYRYSNLKWGLGRDVDDPVWSQRLYKEAQYLFQAEKFRGALIAWAAGGGIVSPSKIIEAVGTPGYYGQDDYNRKSQLLLTKWIEYFQRHYLPFETMAVNLHDNISLEMISDPWDGTQRYGKKTMAPGHCLAKKERGLGPYGFDDLVEAVRQFFREGKMTPRYANEMIGRTEGLQKVQEAIDLLLEKKKIPIVTKVAKGLNYLLFGFNVQEFKIGEWVIFEDKRFPGVIGWLFIMIRKWLVETWAVRKEIIQAMKEEAGKQAGEVFKE